SKEEAKKYAMSVVKTIPEVIEKGVKVERNGRVAIEYQNIRVGLKDNWKGEKLPNHWVITGYEKRSENSESLYTSPLITKGETLPLNSNEPNPTTNALKKQESEQAKAVKDRQKETKKGIKEQKFKTPSEWGHNYSEFKNDGLGAINKLLETKKGFVAGAFHKEGLGDIDLVWGNKDYGLEHILKRRIESYIKKGLKPKFAEQRALNLVRMIPEIIEKGKVGRDAQGRLKIETKDILVALRDNWQDEPLKSKWVITGFEKKVGNIREQAKFIDPSLITKDGERLASSLNSVELNPTTNALKKQESEQAKAVQDMQKESEKGIKEASKTSAEGTEKGIKERAFKVIEDKEAFLKDLNAIKPMPLPREIDTDSFLNAFNGVENKENFIKHLQNKPDAKHQLAYLHLVEPTLKEPDITLIFKDKGKEVKKEHIKAFQGDPKTIYYFLVTQDNNSKLITGLKVKPIYIKAEIDKADIIHSFIPQARTLKE
ncbi:DUF3519 domain-containing protein, partial [Helicobacter pylori]|uniref:DUF3519 domain-containing protein n=1 Tax=Helicobacter pylori TaxID=210 RepID=UPI0036F417FB